MRKSVRAFSLSVELQAMLVRIVGNPELTKRLFPVPMPTCDELGYTREDYDRLYDLLEYGNQFLSPTTLQLSKQFKIMAQPRLYTIEDLGRAVSYTKDPERRMHYYAELTRLTKAQTIAHHAARQRADRSTSLSAVVEALLKLGVRTLEEQEARDCEIIERRNAGQTEDQRIRTRARKASSSRAVA